MQASGQSSCRRKGGLATPGRTHSRVRAPAVGNGTAATPPRLGDHTYEAIRQAILSGLFAPGSRLTVDAVANRLGVSRTPVKEALVRLEREGLVRVVPRRGAFVAMLSAEEVLELYDLREVLDGLAARKAAERITPQELATLARYLRRADKCAATGDLTRYSDADLAFHQAVRQASKSPRLVEMLENLRDQTRLLMSTSILLEGRLQRSIEEHRRIYEALRRRDGPAAEEAARAHMRAARQAVEEYVRSRSGAGAAALSLPVLDA